MKAKNNLIKAEEFLLLANSLGSPKVLLSSVRHIFDAVREKLGPNNSFEEQLLKLQLTHPTHASLIREVYAILEHHKVAPVEFVKKSDFIICSKDYTLEKLTMERVESLLNKAKVFIDEDFTKLPYDRRKN